MSSATVFIKIIKGSKYKVFWLRISRKETNLAKAQEENFYLAASLFSLPLCVKITHPFLQS
jgi:hypothetical protein